MATKIILYISLSLFIFFSFSCENSTEVIDADSLDIPDSISLDSEDTIHARKVKMIFYNVPSPIEMAALIQKAGADYNPEVLNQPANHENYTTNTKTALNLGVYGADLSYTRMFDQIQASVNYLVAIRKLSDGLGIPEEEGSFAVSRLEKNIENKDSILIIISETYATADAYLKENNRGHTASLIIAGGWIEALYIATNIIKKENPNKEIMDRIAEQKYSLENLIELEKSYKDDESVSNILDDLKRIKKEFDKIDIKYTKGEVVTDKEAKKTVIKSSTEINVDINHVIAIRDIVKDIRRKIVE